MIRVLYRQKTACYIKMDIKNIISQISQVYKVNIEKVEEAYKEATEYVESQFPTIKDNEKINKIANILASKFKPTMGGNAKEYKGIVFGFSGKEDANDYQRKSQLAIYNRQKEEFEQAGDKTAIDQMVGVLINIGENGEIIPLYPHLKNDGTVSKMAGKPIPSPEDSMVRQVYGVCYPADADNAEESASVFKLSLSKKAIDNLPPIGKVVSFKCGGKEYNGEYMLNSSATDFVEEKDDFLSAGIEAVGLTGIAKKYMSNREVTKEMIAQWVSDFVENPNERSIPKEFSQWVYIDDLSCMTQNFEVNDKGKIGMTFVHNAFSLENKDVVSSGFPEVGDAIEFAQNSSCGIIGQLNIFGKDEPVVYMNLFGAVPKKDEFIPRMRDAKPIGKPDPAVEKTDNPKVEENKPETVKGGW